MKTYDTEIWNAAYRIAKAAYERSREVCPVRTGRLKNSITLTRTPDGGVISTDVYYAQAVEFGGPRNKPRHFLGSGAQLAADTAAEIVAAELFGERSGHDRY